MRLTIGEIVNTLKDMTGKIKQLKWEQDGNQESMTYAWGVGSAYIIAARGTLTHPFAVFRAYNLRDKREQMLDRDSRPAVTKTLEEAKAFCQGDFEEQVNSYIES